MQNNFYTELNKNTLNAIREDKTFFINLSEIQLPLINNSFTGNPVTGANYFNIKLSNDLNGAAHTEYVKMNEALTSKAGWFSALSDENKPKGTLYQDENTLGKDRYSFVIPTAMLNQDIFTDNPQTTAPKKNYVPFQTSNTNMNDFENFVQEQFTNVINSAYTGAEYRSNIKETETNNFKTMLIDAITRDPAFMAEIANKAYQNVMDCHYVPFDKKSFIENARVENSPEFSQLNSAIASHIEDMHNNKKPSFNREFNELAQPLIIKIENLHIDNSNQKNIIDRETTEFVKEKIMQDKPAGILADVFAGTFVEKAVKLANVGKKIFAGVAIACAIINGDPVQAVGLLPALITTNRDEHNKNMALSQTAQFIQKVAEKIGGNTAADSDSLTTKCIKIIDNIITSQSLKGNGDLSSSRDSGNSHSLFTQLNQTIRSDPNTLDMVIAQMNNQSRSVHMGTASRR